MFNTRPSLRVSRKGIVRLSTAQMNNLEALKNLDEKIDKCTIEEIPLEFKCQFTAKICVLREQIAHSENLDLIQSQIRYLGKFIDDVANGKYRHLTGCDNVDDLRANEHADPSFVAKR